MAWITQLSDKAQKQLERLPKRLRRRLGRAIDELEADPFKGDVLPLKGKKWKGAFRKRVGNFRIIFRLRKETRIIEIALIERRAEKTYR